MLAEGIRSLYGWQNTVEYAQAAKTFAALQDSPHPAERWFGYWHGTLLQRSGSWDQQQFALQKLQQDLLQKIQQHPDVVSTFALAELLNSPLAPRQDVPLAAVLYKYCAERGIAPALLNLGRILAFYEPLKNPPAAERLLRQAAENDVNGAYAVLAELYNRHQKYDAAQRALKLAAKYDPSTAGLLTEINSPEKNSSTVKQVIQHLNEYPDIGSRILAKHYFDRIQRDLPMAINCALLAERYNYATPEVRNILSQSDRECGLVLVMYAMWQNRLQCGKDLQQVILPEAETLILHCRYQRFDYLLSELTRLLAETPEKVLYSGLLLQLHEYDFPLAKLFLLLPDNLAGALTGTILSIQNSDAALQEIWSCKLITHLAVQSEPSGKNLLRQKLMPLIHGVALLKDTPEVLPEPYHVLWNLAVQLHADALYGQGKTAAAERILQRYPRHKLPANWRQYEENFRKKYLQNTPYPQL